jgi:hypothetical protein
MNKIPLYDNNTEFPPADAREPGVFDDVPLDDDFLMNDILNLIIHPEEPPVQRKRNRPETKLLSDLTWTYHETIYVVQSTRIVNGPFMLPANEAVLEPELNHILSDIRYYRWYPNLNVHAFNLPHCGGVAPEMKKITLVRKLKNYFETKTPSNRAKLVAAISADWK